MSLRRPKMQIKPKLSVRSLTPKSGTDTQKQSLDSRVKSVDSVVKETQLSDNSLSELNDNSVMQLTTKVIPVDTSEVEINEDNGSTNECLNDTTFERSIELNANNSVDTTIVFEDDIQRVEPKETNISEVDSKQQKTSESKSKSKSDSNRKRKICRNTQKSDKSVMRMKDLLLYNPPMTDEQKEMRDKDTDQSEKITETQTTDDKTKTEESNDSETNAGPRVKVGTDGLLILDEESVVVKRHKTEVSESTILESAGTTSALTNYSSFRSRAKGTSKPRWTEHETIRFYSALNTIGTDFTLMANLFFRGKRTRLDLRNKFKKEERINKLMIDEALFSPNTFINQCPELDDLLNDSTDSDEDTEEQNVSIKQKSKKSKS